MPVSRDPRRTGSLARSSSRDINASENSSPSSTPANALGANPLSYFGSLAIADSFSLDAPHSESSGSNSLPISHKNSIAALASGGGATQKNFVGTPDYLAPESILGIGMDAGVDWVSQNLDFKRDVFSNLTFFFFFYSGLLELFVTSVFNFYLYSSPSKANKLNLFFFRFLYGLPPFHDETPEKVFANILSRRIDWHEDEIDISLEARDFMERLLCSDASKRLGRGGTAEVKAHPFLAGIQWDNLLTGEVDFIPKISDPESTDYFDPRGATAQVFSDDEGHADDSISLHSDPTPDSSRRPSNAAFDHSSRRHTHERTATDPSPNEDFGTFNFRNLPVLKQANDDVIKKMRDEQMLPPLITPLDSPVTHTRPLGSLSGRSAKPRSGSNDFMVS